MGVRLSRGEFFFDGGWHPEADDGPLKWHARLWFFEALERLAPEILKKLKSDVWPVYETFRDAINTAMAPLANLNDWEDFEASMAIHSRFWSTVADPHGTLANLPHLGNGARVILGSLNTQDIIDTARNLEDAIGRWASTYNLVSKGTQELLLKGGAGYLSHAQRDNILQRIQALSNKKDVPEDLRPFINSQPGFMTFINVPFTWGQEKAGVPEAWILDKALDTMARWFEAPATLEALIWFPSDGAAGWEHGGPTGLKMEGDDENALEAFIYRQQINAFFKSLHTLVGIDELEHGSHPQFPAFHALAAKLAKMQAKSDAPGFKRSYTDPVTFDLEEISALKPELTATIPGWMPVLETWQDFEKEALKAFKAALGQYRGEVEDLMAACGFERASAKSRIDSHVEWFVQVQVLGKGYTELSYELAPSVYKAPDPSTIREAVEAVAKLIELPLREMKRGRPLTTM